MHMSTRGSSTLRSVTVLPPAARGRWLAAREAVDSNIDDDLAKILCKRALLVLVLASIHRWPSGVPRHSAAAVRWGLAPAAVNIGSSETAASIRVTNACWQHLNRGADRGCVLSNW